MDVLRDSASAICLLVSGGYASESCLRSSAHTVVESPLPPSLLPQLAICRAQNCSGCSHNIHDPPRVTGTSHAASTGYRLDRGFHGAGIRVHRLCPSQR